MEASHRVDSVERCEEATPLYGAVSASIGALSEVLRKLQTVREEAQSYELLIADFERRVQVAQAAQRTAVAQLAQSEERAARVTSLYVATYQLHASLDPADVRATIAEIATNLLGAESFVLLLRGAPGTPYQVALEQGLEEDTSGLFADGRYIGRDPLIDATFADGELRIATGTPANGTTSNVLAVVPLVAQDKLVGSLVILKLLRHRGALQAHDRDLLDLLGAHAASALFIAQVHANADRKLKTLESLVKLAQRT